MVEVDPPGGEGEHQAADADGQQLGGQAGLVERGLEPDVGGQDRLAQNDDREQPVALLDVAGVEHRLRGGPLGPHGHGQLDQPEDDEDASRPARRMASRRTQRIWSAVMPRGVAQRPLPALRHVPGDPQPGHHEPEAHDHVAGDGHAEVLVLDRPGDARGQDQDAGHLHQREQPVGHVVGIVGRVEPREVHPRPPHGEEHRGEADDPVGDVAGQQLVVQGRGGPADRHHEGQVEQQLERRGGPRSSAGSRSTARPRSRSGVSLSRIAICRR